jgi:type I restriction enzyme R subunit
LLWKKIPSFKIICSWRFLKNEIDELIKEQEKEIKMINQNPEQLARDNIDKRLVACGWQVQSMAKINLSSCLGVAVREYSTDVGFADYVLFIDGKPCGIIEAKRQEEGHRTNIHEEQAENYAKAQLKYLKNNQLPFVYISTGEKNLFTNFNDPKPRAREVFNFHRPETLQDWVKMGKSLRARLLDLPTLPIEKLRDCQISAINNLEKSFKENRPKALIQMATGSGKTFTAITFIYRLLRFAKAKRILFLVDTKNLGEQAEQEFMQFIPNDDNRKFSELYAVSRLKSSYIPKDSQVIISTIQRLYSVLKGEELDEKIEEENPNENSWQPKKIPPLEYDPKMPIEFFDFIVIDECHRSIYNLWKQVLDYYDAFQIGLTATPDKRTIGYFDQNIVSEYSHEMAVADGVNVPSKIFIIDTKITNQGAIIPAQEYVEHREKLSRKKRIELQDEDLEYSKKQLDCEVFNENQIRTIIKSFKENLSKIFPDRFDEKGNFEVPKTLIFAKTDSHADDIINVVRQEFCEENKFCRKITYNSEDPKSVLADFRGSFYPRIAVTVDMIATGTDVKPLECLLFMRDVKSRNYFEQMKGRGTRTIDLDSLKKVTPTAKFTKDHFVIFDAIGVSKSLKTDIQPLDKKPSIPLKDLLRAIAVGARDEGLFTTIASRLVGLEKQLTEKQKQEFEKKSGGKTIPQIAKELLTAFDPDVLEEINDKTKIEKFQNEVAKVFTGELNEFIENFRKILEQKIDNFNPDEIIFAGWHQDNKENSLELIKNFEDWIGANKNELNALQIFYNQPYRRRELTYNDIKQVLEKLKSEKPILNPLNVWKAFEATTEINGKVDGQIENELSALISLIRKNSGIDKTLVNYSKTVDKNFQNWVFKKQSGKLKYNEEQMEWLRLIKEHNTASFHIDKDDFDLNPFNAKGGLGKMWQLFGDQSDGIIDELNEALSL